MQTVLKIVIRSFSNLAIYSNLMTRSSAKKRQITAHDPLQSMAELCPVARVLDRKINSILNIIAFSINRNNKLVLQYRCIEIKYTRQVRNTSRGTHDRPFYMHDSFHKLLRNLERLSQEEKALKTRNYERIQTLSVVMNALFKH